MTDSNYKRHGGPYDRGRADSYYRRPRNPHYFWGNTYNSEEITRDKMTKEEVEAYNQGFSDNEYEGNYKEWN